jgi:flagellin-like hook-associated protein FlgL
MPIVVNSNTTATTASFNLSHANDALRKSLARLSSGNRIVSPADDAGGMAVAYKLNSKLKRTEAVRQNVQNGISYLQVQDGAMSTVGKIADRMAELRTMASDITKNTGDVENYSKEFIELQRQLNQIRNQKFNGISLFATSQTLGTTSPPEMRPPLDKQGMTLDDQGRAYAKFGRQILTSADGVVQDGNVSLNVINLQYVLSIGQVDTRFVSTAAANDVTAGQTGETINGRNVYVNLGNVDNGNVGDFGAATQDELYTSDGFIKSILFVSMGSFVDILGRIADARAENGAEQNRLSMTNALLMQNQTNLEAAHGRIMDADIALESTRLARQNVLVQSSAAMVAQANQLTSIALTVLG